MSAMEMCGRCGAEYPDDWMHRCSVHGSSTRPPPDPVNTPTHYLDGGIECIDAIRAALGDAGFLAFCRGNAIKYSWRAHRKGHHDQDMAKAAWYARMASGDDPRAER